MCAICNRTGGVQVHHIVLRSDGGSDDASNAIPLCPNCHDEVHAGQAVGRTTRRYTDAELRGHLARTVDLAGKQASLRPGGESWEHDIALIGFYVQCLDRPAFRTWFHLELSFADFDQALEDTSLAINTGFWRTRDGAVIERAKGKSQVINPEWRAKLDQAVGEVDAAHAALRRDLGLDLDLMQMDHGGYGRGIFDDYGHHLRADRSLGQEIDRHRQAAIDCVNEIVVTLGGVGLAPLGA